MKKLFFATFVALSATAVIAFSAVSCKEHCEVDGVAVFELSQSEFQMANYGGIVSVKVASKVNWTAESTEDWIKLKAEDIESVDGREADKDFASSIAAPFNSDRAGGYVTVEIEVIENPAATQRNGEITFTTTDMQTFTVSVTQTAGAEDSIELDDMEGDDDFDKETKTLHFAAEGGEKSIGFTVTREWTATVAEDAEWCSINPEEGEGGKQTITITAQPTDATAERTTKVTLTSGDAAVVITVVQDGMDSIELDDMEGDDDFDNATKILHFTAKGGDKSLSFTASGDWTATAAEGQSWCSVTPASGEAGNQTITISAKAAESTEERTTTVTLVCGTATITITVKQDGDDSFPDEMELMFPDPIFRAYVLDNFDTSKDGKISTEEAEAVEKLSVKGKHIASLEGVQYFTNLTYLDCDNNELTSLDVSQNTKLTNLSCPYNQLISLNVSGCVQLTTLHCWSNQLTSLDVSGCTQLTDLECDSNQLISLDLSHNTELLTMTCTSNQLTTLDVSGCTLLTELSCNNNQLTTLNVSGCAQLTDLYCPSNQLTTLDVSGCTQLKMLYCIDNLLTTLNVSGCTQLKTLTCPYNQLISLNASGCAQLGTMLCYSNKLTSLDVSGCTQLTKLHCASNQLTTLNVNGCAQLTDLDCKYNQLTSLDVSKNTQLTKLECNNNQLTTLNVNGCAQLTELSCSNNQLTTLDVSECPALENLYCYDNQLTALDVSGCAALERLYCYNNQLTSLDVSKTNLGNSTYGWPLDCFPMNGSGLKTLYLKTGWEIPGIYPNQNNDYVSKNTEIKFKD